MKKRTANKISLRKFDPIILPIGPPILAILVRLLMATCRIVRIEGQEKERGALSKSGGGAVYATWHQRMSFFTRYYGKRHLTIMISQSRDGEYASRIATWLGFKNERGSATRGGARAIVAIVKRIRSGEIAGLFADGPQGPSRVAKTGALLIARSAGVPLIPIAWSADKCWTFNSWDRFLIPKPFSRVVILLNDPIWIPRSIRGEELETYRTRFENILNRATRWCDEQFGPERPWRKITGEDTPEIGPLKNH